MHKRCLLILLDGLGDRAHPALGQRTPLETAHTPVLDRLAALGSSGLYHAGQLGEALPSEEAHFAMFGYPPEEFPGRGPLEALGAGIPLADDEVAILAHGACVRDEQGQLFLHRGVPKTDEREAAALLDELPVWTSGKLRFRFHRTKGLFGVLVVSGGAGPFVTDTDPILEGRPVQTPRPWEEWRDDPDSNRTAAALRDYLLQIRRTLAAHPVNAERRRRGASPVNFLVTQRAGRLRPRRPFAEQWGLAGLTISSAIIYWGLGNYLGLEVHRVKDSDDPGRDLAERLVQAHEASDRYDFIHVHTKAPDEAGHTRDPHRKVAVIEALDRGLGTVVDRLLGDPGLILVVASDHSTPSSGTLIHSGEPVPLLFVGEGVRRDRVTRFSEIDAAGGALSSVRGGEILRLVLNSLDRAKLTGLRDTPRDQPYWPGSVEPFRVGDRHE